MLFNIHKPVIGMIHLQSLPGTPKNTLFPEEIIRIALKEAKILHDNGIDAIAIENMHDIPYTKGIVGPEIVSIMSIVTYEIKKAFQIPVGIQVLAAANKEALAIAFNSGLDFIRAEGFVFGHIADEGYIDSNAAELLRYRKQIGAERVKIFTDIKKKHSSHLITADVDVVETSITAEFFASDGIILTGAFTASEPHLMEVKKVKEAIKLPLIMGSGITPENIEKYYEFADGFIIGSYLKNNNNWKEELNPSNIQALMSKIKSLRS
jgi:uncharacterized protein